MTQLSPIAARLLLVLPPEGRITLRRALYLAALTDDAVNTAATLVRAGLIQLHAPWSDRARVTAARLNTHASLTETGRAMQASIRKAA